MKNAEAELELTGNRPHLVRLRFDFSLGRAPARVRMSDYDSTLTDPGEPGTADITGGEAILLRDGKEVRARALPGPILSKLRHDSRLEAWLYQQAIREMPHA